MSMWNRLRIWWWKWRFTDALLSKVAKERNTLTIRFCEQCAADAWAWNFNTDKFGKLEDALAVEPRAFALSMTRGSLSSFHVLHCR